MRNFLQKELNIFFSTPIGYIIIALFILLNSSLLWVIPGSWNVFDSGYANIDALFLITPWLYLFLCPAISMRFFADEKNLGTIELLLTKPVKMWKIVFGKVFAGWILVFIALSPSLLWLISVCFLAEPVGNVDLGTFCGSFMGLILLAMVYLSIGLWSSALTSSQLISFLISAAVSFFMFYGFELLSMLFTGYFSFLTKSLGVYEHYKSISRGVIDSRDVLYFILLSAIFLFLGIKQINKK